MNYSHGKASIANEILPIMLEGRKEGQYYVEPFCGGCNVISKVTGNRIAGDINPYLVSMWRELIYGRNDFPTSIPQKYYNAIRNLYKTKSLSYDIAKIGWIGYMASRNGKFFDGGYAASRDFGRNYIKENIALTLKQAESLKGVSFYVADYRYLPVPPNSIIYCDAPYKSHQITKYEKNFNHNTFYNWCHLYKNSGCKIFVSEIEMPEEFTCIWEWEKGNRIERLFTL